MAPNPTNQTDARAYIFTIVTPDLDASIHYYRDLMGYQVVRRGKLEGKMPRMEGVGNAGRAYALIRTAPDTVTDTGFLRLLEAPAGAAANRPRPSCSIRDPGLGIIECMSRNVDESYVRLTEAGVKVISPPLHYFFRNMKPLSGAQIEGDFDIRSMSAFGPAGEQMFISTMVLFNNKPAWKTSDLPDGVMHGPMLAGSTFCLDRWPLWDFYEKAFGIKPTRDTTTAQENVNTLIGAPKGTYFQFGFMGEGFGMEWWEYRHQAPTAKPPYPTHLDRTGLAMTTVSVPDLGAFEKRLKANDIVPIGTGTLPTPGGHREGLYLRGAVGELFEVVGRSA